MAVYTQVTFDEASALIERLGIGTLTGLESCRGGIENTNYFANTTQGAWVLTLFERLTDTELPFYLHLMKHLARHGIPVPDPQADAAGRILHVLKGKPAAVVNRLPGHHHLAPDNAHGTLDARWSEVMGADVAAHARLVSVREGTLTVAVDDPIWATQLRYLEPAIVTRATALLGPGLVTRVKVRVASS